MRNRDKDNFRNKFNLLNSQKSSEEITWSCSDSSDYENSSLNENYFQNKSLCNRKRKRIKNKKKTLNNISNLNIKYSDSQLDNKNKKEQEKSPIFDKSTKHITSPILTNLKQPWSNRMIKNSPVLQCSTKNCYVDKPSFTSPILTLKHSSPKPLPKVRKKLFINNNNIEIMATSKIIIENNPVVLNNSEISINSCIKSNMKEMNRINIRDHIVVNTISNENKTLADNEIKLKNEIKNEDNREEIISDNVSVTSTSSVSLVDKVKSYFDSHFSSATPSQQSISDFETTSKNSSKTSEEIELINSLPELKNLPQPIKLENRSSSDSLRSLEDFSIQKSKKIRYKKDGLSHRLSLLTKKQKANLSLWQHERFLAANSNFVIPNENFSVFRVRKVLFQYGCYLLDAIDRKEDKHLVVINNIFVNNISIEMDTIFKLYKPYKVIDCDRDYKIVVNVCKFECTALNK